MKNFIGFYVFIVLLAAFGCVSSPKNSFEEFAGKHVKYTIKFDLDQNYQKVFAEALPVVEKCFENSMYGNTTKIESNLDSEKGKAELRAVIGNFMFKNLFAWAVVEKTTSESSNITVTGKPYAVKMLGKYLKGQRKCR